MKKLRNGFFVFNGTESDQRKCLGIERSFKQFIIAETSASHIKRRGILGDGKRYYELKIAGGRRFY